MNFGNEMVVHKWCNVKFVIHKKKKKNDSLIIHVGKDNLKKKKKKVRKAAPWH
jgi:Cu/Zn superoxide dismutase